MEPSRDEMLLGVDLGGTKVEAGLVDLRGRVVVSHRYPTHPDKGPDVVRLAPNLRWQHVPLRERLMDALRIPVVVTNDVRAAA